MLHHVAAEVALAAQDGMKRVGIVTSHPGYFHYLRRSKNWQLDRAGFVAPPGNKKFQKTSSEHKSRFISGSSISCSRFTVAARYVGQPLEKTQARQLWEEPRHSAGERAVLAIVQTQPGCAESYLCRRLKITAAELRPHLAKLISGGQIVRRRAKGLPATYAAAPIKASS